ncbi:MAG: hypothetical protein LUG96_16140 [Tannerellaceae bacterium]|nr:hypothetical protein [Tannerellaceae bacterium]MCD7916636.1 hypothetical protein [Tannerellaceae bacterium]
MRKEHVLKVNEEITPLSSTEENTFKGGYGVVDSDLVGPTPFATNGNCTSSGWFDTNGNCGCSTCGSATVGYY